MEFELFTPTFFLCTQNLSTPMLSKFLYIDAVEKNYRKNRRRHGFHIYVYCTVSKKPGQKFQGRNVWCYSNGKEIDFSRSGIHFFRTKSQPPPYPSNFTGKHDKIARARPAVGCLGVALSTACSFTNLDHSWRSPPRSQDTGHLLVTAGK